MLSSTFGSKQPEDIEDALGQMGVEISDECFEGLMDEFDTNRSGNLDITEFTDMLTKAAPLTTIFPATSRRFCYKSVARHKGREAQQLLT